MEEYFAFLEKTSHLFISESNGLSITIHFAIFKNGSAYSTCLLVGVEINTPVGQNSRACSNPVITLTLSGINLLQAKTFQLL